MKRNKRRKEDILRLRAEGKSFDQIHKELGCSKSVISYHCGNGNEKKRVLQNSKKRSILEKKVGRFRRALSKDTLRVKLKEFKRHSKNAKSNGIVNNISKDYSIKDVVKKIGLNPKCYLTGKKIDINDGSSYHLDHIIPTSRGGTNDLDNLNICLAEANMAKGQLMLDEFYELIEDILKHRDQNK